MEKSDDTSKLISAVVMGAAIGLALGILFAPEKGSATRKKMMNGLKDLAEELNETLNGEEEAEQENGSEPKTNA